MPPQILLFVENIWDFAEGDEDVFCEEVRVTYYHELGHYLGLEEDELNLAGLNNGPGIKQNRGEIPLFLQGNLRLSPSRSDLGWGHGR